MTLALVASLAMETAIPMPYVAGYPSVRTAEGTYRIALGSPGSYVCAAPTLRVPKRLRFRAESFRVDLPAKVRAPFPGHPDIAGVWASTRFARCGRGWCGRAGKSRWWTRRPRAAAPTA